MPRGYVEDEVADGAVWVHLKTGEPPVLVKRIGSRLEILALIVHEFYYERARLPFYDLVTWAVVSTFPAGFAEALETYD